MKKLSEKEVLTILNRGVMKLSVIITAGGSSVRFGWNKLLEKLNGKDVFLHSIGKFLPLNPSEIILSASEPFIPEAKRLTGGIPALKIVKGGSTRQESVFNALKACDNPDFVAIHDAARPLVMVEDIKKCLEKAAETGAAILAVKATDTIKKADENGKIIETPERSSLWCVQTPQIFDYELIFNAHKKLAGGSFSDDSGMLEALGHEVYVVEGHYSNLKITTPADICIAQSLLGGERC